MEISNILKRRGDAVNISQQERWASIIGGGALIGYGLQKRSLAGAGLAAIGGVIAFRGATGHCDVFQALGLNTSGRGRGRNVSVPYEQGIRVDKAITINKPRTEVYQYWRNLENLPKFMRHLSSVREIDNRHSHWVAKGPVGTHVEWEAEIINEIENELIGWRSIAGDVGNAGSVHFKDAPGGRGTELSVELQYDPPGGAVAATFAKLFGEEPSIQIEEDLRRFKQLMETGEISTSDGPSNRKSASSPKGWVHDQVQQSSQESFPASDAPSWTPEALAQH